MNLHDSLLEDYHNLGHPKTGGICHGFSVRYMEACLTDDESLFDDRIKQILDYKKRKLNIKLLLDEAIEAIKVKKTASSEDKNTIDIAAFYSSIAIFQSPYSYRKLFADTPFNQTHIEELAYFSSSTKSHSKGGLNKIYTEPTIYTPTELTEYLSQLSTIIDSISPLEKDNFGFTMSGYDHTVVLIYNSFTGWKFMDINSYPPVILNKQQTAQLPLLLYNALKKSKVTTPPAFIPAGITLFTIGLDKDRLSKLNEQLAVFKAKHVIDEDIVNRIDNGISLAHITVAYNDTKPLLQIAKHAKVLLEMENPAGYTPLHSAAVRGYAAMVAVLARHRVKLNKLVAGNTAAVLAAVYGHTAVIKILGQYGADLNLPDANGYPPLYHALKKEHFDTAEMLIACRANPNQEISNGIPLLCDAIERGDTVSALKLLSHGANPNQPTHAGNTPLHTAARKGFTALIINIALSNKTDFNSVTKKGFTPLFLAAGAGHMDAVSMLVVYGAKYNKEHQILPDDLINQVSTSGADIKERMGKFINNQIAFSKNTVTIKASDIAQIMGHNKIADFLNNRTGFTLSNLISRRAISPRGMQVSIFRVEPPKTSLGVLQSSDSLPNQLHSKCNL